MPKEFPLTTYIERGPCQHEVEVQVRYTVSGGTAPTLVDPGAPLEIEVVYVSLDDLTDDEWDRIQQECDDDAPSALEDEAATEADYRYEQARDRQMMERWERENDQLPIGKDS